MSYTRIYTSKFHRFISVFIKLLLDSLGIYPMSRLMYVSPLTPPSSDPGSPGGTLPRRTPPPPYPAPGSTQQTPAMPARRLDNTGTRYNRRNNPELEKRRIHHCDYIGKLSILPNLFIAKKTQFGNY